MKTAKAALDCCFDQKRIAVIGVSRNPRRFSRVVFSSLRKHGYDAVPVNPAAAEIDGVPAAGGLSDVKPAPGALLVLTAVIPAGIPEQAAACGARALWFYNTPPFALISSRTDLRIVAGECPLLFLRQPGWIHSAHRALRSLFGTFPS